MSLFNFLRLVCLITCGTLIKVGGGACDKAIAEGKLLIPVAVKCFGEVFLTAVALTRSGSICSTRCLFLKLNLVEWQKMIVIISSKL